MKYKEIRMFIIMICLFLAMLAGTIYFITTKDLARILIASLITFITFTMVLSRYGMKIFNDSLLGYEFKGIGIMPILIDFKDIKNIELLSLHKVRIEHLYVTKLYIVNGEAFYQEAMKNIEKYKNSGQ